jgi:hypothetical protein
VSGTPMLKATGLWEKTSAAGNFYLIGRLGGVRIMVLKNRDAGVEGEPDWHVFFADGEKREDTRAQTSSSAARPSREPRRRAPYPAQRQTRPPSRPDQPGAMLPDDDVSDIGRGSAT